MVNDEHSRIRALGYLGPWMDLIHPGTRRLFSDVVSPGFVLNVGNRATACNARQVSPMAL
eukprot:683722-Pyramimonas_sp.AAC.1